MITKQEFDIATKSARANLALVLPKMISYKSYVQRAILNVATQKELADVRDGRINQVLIDKLCHIAHQEWMLSQDATSLYCVAIAVATIVKEYDWGTQYLIGNGLWEIAQRIQNA